MNRLWAVFALSLLFLSGCSSGTTTTDTDGEALYNKSCVACHGEKLQGAVGPTLVNLKSKYPEAKVLKIINKGTSKMPGNLLSKEESETVTKWLMEK